jgi:hypothetical protein
LGLLALFAITVLFAAGALFVKYKLENLRAVVEQGVESRTGARIQVGAVVVNGLRGLRVDNAEVSLSSERGPTLHFAAPVTYIYINVVDLLHGAVTVEYIEADNATVRLSRGSDQPWFSPEGLDVKENPRILSMPSFRILGKKGTFEVDNVAGSSPLMISDFGFDVGRLTESTDIAAKLSGKLGGKDNNDIKLNLRYTSMEDFDLRVQCATISAADVAGFFPASQRFVSSGRLSPSFRLAGLPNMTLVVAFEASFRDVMLKDQPDFIRPAEGTLTGVASYDSARHVLTLTTAKAESDQLAGRLEGSIAFNGPVPRLDLRLDATRLPVTEALSYIIKGRADKYGAYDFSLGEPYQVYLTLEGTTDAPEISFHGSAASGAFSLAAKESAFPEGQLQLGPINFTWSSQSPTPSGSLSITDGTLTHNVSGLTAQHVSGVLVVDDNRISIDPLNMEITGNPFVGRLKYDLETEQLEVTANGTLSGVEKTSLGQLVKEGSLGGSVNLRCDLARSGERYTVDADVDATQAEMRYQDWLMKPRGVGASARKLHVEAAPGEGVSITAQGDVATSPFSFEAKLRPAKEKWLLETASVFSGKIDIEALGKLLRIPYKVAGGVATDASLVWRRVTPGESSWEMAFTGNVDKISLLPEGAAKPVSGEALQVDVTMTGGPQPGGALNLHAKWAQLPPIREKWFAAFEPDQMFSSLKRPWQIELAAEGLQVLPWKAADFTGTAYTNSVEAGMRSFSAKIEGGGRVEGTYRNIKQDNAYEMTLKWTDIPATYLIEQLNYPKILTGTASGEASYSMDRDDPGTLKGQGRFEIRDGRFSADFLVSQIEGKLENKISALPPSLKFSLLTSDLSFEGDTFVTPNLRLESEGVKVAGKGSFVTHGDMDYDLKVSVTPKMAERIPALRDNFNIKGLRLTQQDIDLAFKVKGPTFNPQGELSELPPLGVTLVSSAFEVTSDAMRVIDIPRKILTDLIKIGGGIVGIQK